MKLNNLFVLALVFMLACTQTEKKKESIPVLDFNQLKPYLSKSNDTLDIVNFWATWCTPCVRELPDFEKVNAEYKDRKFKMLLVSLDFPQQVESKVIPFIKDKNLQAEVLLLFDTDANTWINEVSNEWTGSIPATLIYKKDFRSFYEGSYTYEELKHIVESNLN